MALTLLKELANSESQTLGEKEKSNPSLLAKLCTEAASIDVAVGLLWYATEHFTLSEEFWIGWLEDKGDACRDRSVLEPVYERALAQTYSQKLWLKYLFLKSPLEDNREDGLTSFRSIADRARKLFKYDIRSSYPIYRYIVDCEMKFLKSGKEAIPRARSLYRDWLQAPSYQVESVFEEYSMFETKYGGDSYEGNMSLASRFYSTAAALSDDIDLWSQRVGLTSNASDVRSLKTVIGALHAVETERKFVKMEPYKSVDEWPWVVLGIYNQLSVFFSNSSVYWETFLVFIARRLPAKSRTEVFNRIFSRAAGLPDVCSGKFWRTSLIAGAALGLKDEVLARMKTCKPLWRSAGCFIAGEALFEVDFVALFKAKGEELTEERLWRVYNLLNSWRDPKLVDEKNLWVQRQILLLRHHSAVAGGKVSQLYESLLQNQPDNGDVWCAYARYAFETCSASTGFAILNRALTRPELGNREAVYTAYTQSAVLYGRSFDAMLDARSRIAVHEHLLRGGYKPETLPEPVKKRKLDGDALFAADARSELDPLHSKKRRPEVISSLLADRMILLKNLAPQTDFTALYKTFRECGAVEDISLWRPTAEGNPYLGKRSGAAGRAFLEFESTIAVQKALDLADGCGFEAFPCVTRMKATAKRFGKERDPFTVYVSPLPVRVKKYQLRQVFESVGTIKEVRIVPKSDLAYAYVEFKSESAAADAVAKFDGKALVLCEGLSAKSDAPPWEGRVDVRISDPKIGHSRFSAGFSWDSDRAIVAMNLPSSFCESQVREFFVKVEYVFHYNKLRSTANSVQRN